MGFDPVKRRFFVAALGEERVEELERRLFGLGKDLERRGVGFKIGELFEDVVSFADDEAVRLFGVFMGIADNITRAPELTVPDKLEKLRQAVADLASRVGGKTGDSANPARRYIDDLLAPQPATTKAAKALRETGEPGADYVADLLDGRVVRS